MPNHTVVEMGRAAMDMKYTTPEQIAQLQQELAEARRQALDQKGGRTARQKVLHWLSWVSFSIVMLVLGAALVTVLIAKGQGQTPSILGYQLYVVQSGSMEPTFNIGTFIVGKTPADPASLKKGDVVTFVDEGVTVTHRIVEVIDTNGAVQYRTKGDNPDNDVDQNTLTPDRVKAVFVLRIPLT